MGRHNAVPIAICLALAAGRTALGHETDQYSVPVGREFADLRFFFSEEVYDALSAAVAKTNARIKATLRKGTPSAETARLQSPDQMAWAVLLEFPPVINYVETLEMQLRSREVTRRFPGLVVAYMPTLWIYHHWALLVDPTKLVRLWRSSTVMINGTYLGTDKIVHFIHMGYIYFTTYRQAIADGASEEEATRRAVELGTGAHPLSEGALLGFLTTGVISNADLAADFAGLKFFRNLAEQMKIGDKVLPPMLVRNGDFWRLNQHVRRDSDFFSAFVTPHWNEVFNPNVYSFGMDGPVGEEIKKRCDHVLDWYRDAAGRPLSQAEFRSIHRDLAKYFGEDYGYSGNLDEMVSAASVCFDRASDGDEANTISVELVKNPSMPSGGPDELGRSALWHAARSGRADDVQSFTRANPQLDIDGESPLHAAARAGHPAVVDALLSRGASPKSRAENGQTPLHLAARGGYADIVRALLRHGADPNAKDAFGYTALHDAAAHGFAPIVQALLDEGAGVDAADGYGCTPLHRAARAGKAEAVRALLAARADVRKANLAGKTPLDEAKFSKDRRTIDLIRAGNSKAHSARSTSR